MRALYYATEGICSVRNSQERLKGTAKGGVKEKVSFILKQDEASGQRWPWTKYTTRLSAESVAQATETIGAKDFGWEEGEMTTI